MTVLPLPLPLPLPLVEADPGAALSPAPNASLPNASPPNADPARGFASEGRLAGRRVLGMFARQPLPGRVKTRLAATLGADRAAALYECCVRDLLDRLSDCGDARLVGFAPAVPAAEAWFRQAVEQSRSHWQLWPQPEGDLGSRIAAFFEFALCSTATEPVRAVLIGSDSPSLPLAALEDAWQILAERDCVLGPAVDGGYWLIGLSSAALGRPGWRSLFEGIPWSTSDVLTMTIERLQAAGLSMGRVTPGFDLDQEADLTTLWQQLAPSGSPGDRLDLPRTTAWLEQFFAMNTARDPR